MIKFIANQGKAIISASGPADEIIAEVGSVFLQIIENISDTPEEAAHYVDCVCAILVELTPTLLESVAAKKQSDKS